MIDEAHKQFQRWAAWVLAPEPMGNLGFGKNILQRIKEGRGSLLPGSTSRVVPPMDSVALRVDKYIHKEMTVQDARLVKTFYLSPYWTVEKRALKLRVPVRTLYDRLERIHCTYMAHQRSNELKK